MKKDLFEIIISVIAAIIIWLAIVFVSKGVIYLLDWARGLENDFFQTLFRDLIVPGVIAPYFSLILVQDCKKTSVVFLKSLIFLSTVFTFVFFEVININSTNYKNYILIALPISCLFAYFKIISDFKDYGRIEMD